MLPCTVAAQAAPAAGANTATLIARLDSAMSAGLARDRIVGGAYVLVLDGRVVASRGFGVTHTESRNRVHPDSTVFGLASTTKLFTAIAAAKLAREGRLDLDAPIAPYLGSGPIASRVDDVTVARLLTHTAGYDDPTIGSASRTANGLLRLGTYLDRSLTPPWIRPGTHTSYSNVGVALAGHIVATASGSSFAGLLDSGVFIPFGMSRSSVRQPLPAAMQNARAMPYASSGDRKSPVAQIFFNDAPASAAYATPHDMGLLMQHLLRPATAEDSALATSIFSRRFSNHPALPGMTLAFRESSDGTEIFEHGGDWQDYSNGLYLDTQSGTGLFAVFSSSEGSQTALDLWSLVREELPARPNRYTFTQRPTGAAGPGRCSKVDGTYRDTRMSRHTIAKLGVLTGDVREVSVRIAPPGIMIGGRTYEEMGGGVFQSDSGQTIAFRCENAGEASHMFFGRAPASTYRRVPTGESRVAQGGLLIVTLIATIAAAVADVKRRRVAKDVLDNVARVLRIVFGLAAVLLFLGMIFFLATTSPWEFQYGAPANIAMMSGMARFIAAGAAIAFVASLIALVRPRAAAGLLEAMLGIPVVLFIALMVQWSLIQAFS